MPSNVKFKGYRDQNNASNQLAWIATEFLFETLYHLKFKTISSHKGKYVAAFYLPCW